MNVSVGRKITCLEPPPTTLDNAWINLSPISEMIITIFSFPGLFASSYFKKYDCGIDEVAYSVNGCL